MRTWLFSIVLAATWFVPVQSVHAQGGAHIGCIGHRFLFEPNGITYVEGSTRVGQPCQIAFGLMGADIEVLQITVRPSHGVLGASEKEANRRYIAYAPSAGFVGRDQFEVYIEYAPPNRPRATTRVRVGMNVMH